MTDTRGSGRSPVHVYPDFDDERKHETEGHACWCEPEVIPPEEPGAAQVVVHRRVQ